MTTKKDKYIIFLIIAISAMVAARGLFTNHQLAGHDTAAYYITQHQFHKNIADGVLFPRWAPDMRYGYGHPKLQYRPPLLHSFAEPFYAITGNPALSINIAVILLVVIAAFGMFFCCRMYMTAPSAMLGAIAYITFNYLLADIYIRGAYYEVAAYAFMPWILWAQTAIFRSKSNVKQTSIPLVYSCCRSLKSPVFVCGLGWTALICSHPQIMTFFVPLALIHFFFTWNETRNNKAAIFAILATFAGFMIAAPYWYVAICELPWVRMNLFYTGLEAYPRHFISLQELFSETWPIQYQRFAYLDYLNRPRHFEMRSFNLWIFAILLTVPTMWFSRNSQNSRFTRISLLFYLGFLGLVTLSLPVSRGIWFAVTAFHTFNFPWRVLAVTGVCLAILTGLTADELLKRLDLRVQTFSLGIILSIIMLLSAWPKSTGWKAGKDQLIEKINDQMIQNSAGIPKQFYTPKWITHYATSPSTLPIRFISGKGKAKIIFKKTTEWKIKVNTETNAKIAIAQYYYPGWTIFGLAGKTIATYPLPGTGEISFDIPPGTHNISLKFTNTTDRTMANIFAWIGILILLVLIARKSNHKDTKLMSLQ
jgi:hypothetical protein